LKDKSHFSLLVFALVALIVCGCGVTPSALQEIRGETMGTRYLFKCAVSPERVVEIQAHVEALLEQFDIELSNWNPDSWVSRFNQSESVQWQDAPRSVVRILEASKTIHTLSGGAFDVTLSPLIDLWGFGSKNRAGLPDQTEIEEQMQTIGMDQLELDVSGLRIRKAHSRLRINCSAIAKGYAVDLIAEYLSSQGIERYLVEIGGEIRAAQPESTEDHWTVGIRKPRAGQAQLQTKLALRNGAMATSGDYIKFTEADGVRYSHVIDPLTGSPVQHQLHSVTVIAATCSTADALATACLVLGAEAGRRLIDEIEGVEAYFVETADDGDIQIHRTSDFSSLRSWLSQGVFKGTG
jgi:thiamine biosynthesis lipoprotein